MYELIQNAEDNSYEHAISEGQKPFLKFSLYPDRMVVDSNEYGFTEDDVKALCNANVSTKSDHQGYIGEKGIGFKSVFKIAKKVHIQSEPYPFSFVYSRDPDHEDGLGMVTPIQEEYRDLPENVQTRFTLTLLTQSGFEKRREDMKETPESLLLFLTTLRELRLMLHDPSGNVTEVIYSYQRDDSRELDIVLKEELFNGELDHERESLFRVAKRVITALPFDEKRRGIDEAAVVLAFPVNNSGNPTLEDQHVFAYLPLRRVGFKFLIQSDFVTQASREDVSHS
ncbi:hypothetical protein BK809_0008060 [Diplodia seriata]|uniref:Uncharacterized protein n=1 Tax=Diplodia seriata TaxID=420778 RepID=A0A1S8BKG2_9PEZI|nr:hypothetical protein BK809_0008060 [Diplodia seriata]